LATTTSLIEVATIVVVVVVVARALIVASLVAGWGVGGTVASRLLFVSHMGWDVRHRCFLFCFTLLAFFVCGVGNPPVNPGESFVASLPPNSWQPSAHHSYLKNIPCLSLIY